MLGPWNMMNKYLIILTIEGNEYTEEIKFGSIFKV